MSFVSDILGTAKDNVKGIAAGAVGQLAEGNISGAISSIASIPGSLLDNMGARGSAAYGDGFRGIHARKDAVQDWNWYCILPTVDGKSLPWYYVTAANTPHRKFNVETLKRNGHSAHFVESYETTGSLQLSFFLDSSSKAHYYLKAWQRLIMKDDNPALAVNQGIWGLPAAYKKSITVAVMSVDRKDLLIFKYIGCFPSDPTALDLTAGSETPLELKVDFQVEDVELSVRNGLGFLENVKENAKGMALDFIGGGVKSVVSKFAAIPSSLKL